jgi:hypothetical protein
LVARGYTWGQLVPWILAEWGAVPLGLFRSPRDEHDAGVVLVAPPMHTVPKSTDDLFLLTPTVPGVVEPVDDDAMESGHSRYSASSSHMRKRNGLGA